MTQCFYLATDDVFLFDTQYVFDGISVFSVEKKLPWRIENIFQWLWKEFFNQKSGLGGQPMRLFLHNLHIWYPFFWRILKMAQWIYILREEIKKEAQSKADKTTLERPWKDETQYTTLPHLLSIPDVFNYMTSFSMQSQRAASTFHFQQ